MGKLKQAAVWLGAVLLGVALFLLGRDGRALRKTEHRLATEHAKGSAKNLDRAAKLAAKAKTQRQAAAKARAATEDKLEAISAKDPDMDDLMSAWQSLRVRNQRH